jgi:hypothetical protein
VSGRTLIVCTVSQVMKHGDTTLLIANHIASQRYRGRPQTEVVLSSNRKSTDEQQQQQQQQEDSFASRLRALTIQLMSCANTVTDLYTKGLQRRGIFRLGGEDWRIIYITSLL